MRFLLIVLSVVLVSNVYCSKYEDLRSRRAGLKQKLEDLKKAPITIPPASRLEFPLGIPKKKKEELLNDAKQKRNSEIENIKAELNTVSNELQRIEKLKKRVTKITINRTGPLNNEGKLDVWYWHDEKPDIYLKMGDSKICEKQGNCNDFELGENNFHSEITFSIDNPVTIEVWDSDVCMDNKLFDIKVSGKSDSPEKGKAGNFEWSVWWERVEE